MNNTYGLYQSIDKVLQKSRHILGDGVFCTKDILKYLIDDFDLESRFRNQKSLYGTNLTWNGDFPETQAKATHPRDHKSALQS